MRIKRISVTKLFGIFNHVIPLNTEEKVTIIHGRNGFGKTIILKMIDGLFNHRYSIFREIPFEKFEVIFDNDSDVSVTKRPDLTSSESLSCYFHECNHEEKSFLLLEHVPELEESELDDIDERVQELKRIGPKHWLSLVTDEIYSLEEVIEKFGHLLPFLLEKEGQEQKHFKKFISDIKVYLVGTDRLQKLPERRINPSIDFNIMESPRSGFIVSHGGLIAKKSKTSSAVSWYAKQLAEMIRSRLTEYAALSQKLDKTFPTRLFKEPLPPTEQDEQELKQKLEELENKRSRLKEVGLLDQEEEETSQFSSFQENKELAHRVLPIYIQDVEQKLHVFDKDKLAEKLKKFKEVINSHFYHKNMTIDKDRGVIFTTSKGNSLSPNSLSSGEQHQFVLLYGLLFEVEANALILIDEPELSLHLEWQREFLKDAQEITQLIACDVLIATHSPSIINDQWELTVALEDSTT